MIHQIRLIIILLLVLTNYIQGQSNADNSKVAVAYEIKGFPPEIDGILDDKSWEEAIPIDDFLQKDPDEGAPPTEAVEVKFLFDGDALYIGARMYRENIETIVSTLSRRDNQGNSERIILVLDTYHDKRTSYSFGINADGAKFDYYHGTDNEHDRDKSFDPVWEGKSNIDSAGWSAEIRIPFSQLRFSDAEEQIWGLNLNQWTPSKNEDLYWVVVPKDDRGWASRFGSLIGIKGIKPSNRIEILPYATANATFDPSVDSKNPFKSSNDFFSRAGLDFKMGIGPNFTLDATINPDFGQVEADPAVVNLSAFETFYDEKRTFFIEGNSLLKGSGPDYYYSRRIGAQPRGSVKGEYTDKPDNTRILGAAKITGRDDSGLSFAGLSALTARTFADYIDSVGSKKEIEVEPLSSYNLIRLQQEFGVNASTVGIMITGMHRSFSDKSLLNKSLVENAVTGGGDWNLRFDKGNYELFGHFGFSHISGKKEAITGIQQNSTHYYQRPDAEYLGVDSNAVSLTGMSGFLAFEKLGGNNWLWGINGNFETPGFEINDMGRLSSADDINTRSHIRFRDNEPGEIFHSYSSVLVFYNSWNFGGNHLASDISLNSNCNLLNRSNFYLNFQYNFRSLSDNLTRGGPLMGRGWFTGTGFGFSSPWSSNTQWGINFELSKAEFDGKSFFVRGRFFQRTLGRLEYSISPWYNYRVNPRQYITRIESGNLEPLSDRYIFSFIERNTFATQFRFGYAFTADLTVDLYLEPFVASGRYYNFGELAEPGSPDLLFYGTNGTTIEKIADKLRINAYGETFDLSQKDFNRLSFRGNVVLRWEWLPGSTLYFVWQQTKYEETTSSNPINGESFIDTFTSKGINFLALKVSYWLPVD